MWGYDDYPCRGFPVNGDCPWTPGSPTDQCTSFARWRARRDLRVLIPDWGNGGQFGQRARAAGYAVDGSARLHDLVCYPPGIQGSDPKAGHVCALFTIDNGVLWVEEYNFQYPFAYGQRPLSHTAGLEFIHLIPVPAPIPVPVPPPPAEDPDVLILFTAKTASGGLADCLSVSSDLALGQRPRGDGRPARGCGRGRGHPQARPGFGVSAVPLLGVYGVPQDAVSAAEMGVAFS